MDRKTWLTHPLTHGNMDLVSSEIASLRVKMSLKLLYWTKPFFQQICILSQNLLYFQKIIIKFHKSHGILAQNANLLKNGFVQYSSFRVIFTLKLAITELTKSMFPWVKVLVKHVFLSKIFYDWRNKHENLQKSRIWGSKYR